MEKLQSVQCDMEKSEELRQKIELLNKQKDMLQSQLDNIMVLADRRKLVGVIFYFASVLCGFLAMALFVYALVSGGSFLLFSIIFFAAVVCFFGGRYFYENIKKSRLTRKINELTGEIKIKKRELKKQK